MKARCARAHFAMWMLLVPVAVAAATAAVDYRQSIEGIARDVAGLKESYPQLADFSAARNLRADKLSIWYSYHTHKPEPRGGWTSGVPNPDDDGLWFHIDFHDPRSNAEIHTQPAIGIRHCVGDMELSFLHLEGTKTKSILGDVWRVLRKHGVTECDRPS